MFEQVSSDIKDAMKAKDKPKLDALRMLKSRLIENKTAKKPKAELDVVIQYCKQLKDSLTEFPEGSEQAEKVNLELSHLQGYLPKQLSKEEVTDMVKNIISTTENANFGMVMKALTPQIKGKFDGKEASGLVKALMG